MTLSASFTNSRTTTTALVFIGRSTALHPTLDPRPETKKVPAWTTTGGRAIVAGSTNYRLPRDYQFATDTPAPVLAEYVQEMLRGAGGVPILPLLRRAALNLAETTNPWARECPGLVPAEVNAIVHWACVDPKRANGLVDNVVTWRDAAMHRQQAPDPGAATGANAQLHAAKVSEFYQEHSWLGENVSMSPAAELAFCRLLVYCDLLEEAW